MSKLNLEIEAGDCVCLLGLNGSGKTTTLETLANVRSLPQGSVKLEGRPLHDWNRREMAQRVALLTQNHDDPFPTTVLETCLVGRHPHIDFWSWESQDDLNTARQALKEMHLDSLESRLAETLSGGERQRLAIASILAQEPTLLLLDEPINHLDPPHQLLVLDMIKQLAKQGCGVLASFHDISLATRVSNKALLLFDEGEWTFGPVSAVINQDSLESLYKTPFRAIREDSHIHYFPA
ncbi:MAG: ABC transporter ATP-binding protein [Pseudomonadota bacterium]